MARRSRPSEGFHAITGPPEYGGLGPVHGARPGVRGPRTGYRVPPGHESFSVTTDLIAPTVAVFGTDAQRERFVASFLAARELCCQLFSEPGAGSDLAGLACRAVRDGDEWVVDGQKVWSSGAQFCEWGLLVARTDPDVVKHKGLTAFLVPMDADGIDIRPIRQMSGGSSFNEVFFSGCRIPDALRLGPVDGGWGAVARRRWGSSATTAILRVRPAPTARADGGTSCWRPRSPSTSPRTPWSAGS